jgi:hypothetical protein
MVGSPERSARNRGADAEAVLFQTAAPSHGSAGAVLGEEPVQLGAVPILGSSLEDERAAVSGSRAARSYSCKKDCRGHRPGRAIWIQRTLSACGPDCC